MSHVRQRWPWDHPPTKARNTLCVPVGKLCASREGTDEDQQGRGRDSGVSRLRFRITVFLPGQHKATGLAI